jgi:REP element-mobilizing transposase RayT
MSARGKDKVIKRIYYKKHATDKNLKVSELLTSKNGTHYFVRIRTNEDGTYDFNIYNKTSGRIVKEGKGHTNYNSMMRIIKGHVQSLGIQQKQEIRKRTFGLCPKGHTQKIERIVRKKIQEILQNEGENNEESN